MQCWTARALLPHHPSSTGRFFLCELSPVCAFLCGLGVLIACPCVKRHQEAQLMRWRSGTWRANYKLGRCQHSRIGWGMFSCSKMQQVRTSLPFGSFGVSWLCHSHISPQHFPRGCWGPCCSYWSQTSTVKIPAGAYYPRWGVKLKSFAPEVWSHNAAHPQLHLSIPDGRCL